MTPPILHNAADLLARYDVILCDIWGVVHDGRDAYAAAGEASRLAEAAGVDLAKLGEVVRHSDRVTGGPGAIMLRETATPLPDGDGLRPIFEHTRGLGEKDLALAIGLGVELGVDTPVAEQARNQLGAALGVPHDNTTNNGDDR